MTEGKQKDKSIMWVILIEKKLPNSTTHQRSGKEGGSLNKRDLKMQPNAMYGSYLDSDGKKQL